jgi:hypothetical protein
MCLVNKSVIYNVKRGAIGENVASSIDKSAYRGTTLRGITRECPGNIGFKFTNATDKFVI